MEKRWPELTFSQPAFGEHLPGPSSTEGLSTSLRCGREVGCWLLWRQEPPKLAELYGGAEGEDFGGAGGDH